MKTEQSAPTTRETADHAELAALIQDLRDSRTVWDNARARPKEIETQAADALETLLSEIAALRGGRDRIAGESIWWKGVIGDGTHQPSGEVPSIKHMHPAMVKPIYDAHKGTAVADVIAGLIFSLAITQNREQFLVKYANDRAAQAERQRDELRKALEPFALLAPGYGKSPINMGDPLSKWLTVSQLVDAAEALANQGADQ